jgi:hypothetical protein
MRRFRTRAAVALVAGAVGMAPALAAAQGTGTLAICDDPGMTLTQGAMEGPSKEVYLGVRLDHPPTDGFAGLEFSIAGVEQFDAVIPTWLNDPAAVIGSLAAPVDTVNGTGGIQVAWPVCQSDDVVVARLLLVALSPPQDAALVIKRRYPPSNLYYDYPWGGTCDAPCFGCHWRFTGGTYTLNPSVAVRPMGWGAIKSLYRTP